MKIKEIIFFTKFGHEVINKRFYDFEKLIKDSTPIFLAIFLSHLILRWNEKDIRIWSTIVLVFFLFGYFKIKYRFCTICGEPTKKGKRICKECCKRL